MSHTKAEAVAMAMTEVTPIEAIRQHGDPINAQGATLQHNLAKYAFAVPQGAALGYVLAPYYTFAGQAPKHAGISESGGGPTRH